VIWILSLIEALLMLYIGIKVVSMRIKALNFIYAISLGIFTFLVVLGKFLPLLFFTIGSAIIAFIILFFTDL